MVDLLAGQFSGHALHVVGGALYRGPVWRDLPAGVTFTTRLPKSAVLYGPEPPPTGKRGHPRWKGDRLGTPADLAAQAGSEGSWRTTSVDRYGRRDTIEISEVTCLWWGSLHRTPVRVILTRDPGDDDGVYEMALVTTDLDSTAEQIVERYAFRWPIEQTIKDGKDLLGVGEAQSRVQNAVERTVPFQLLCLTILTLWYAHADTAVDDRRTRHPWYRDKRHVSVTDMLTAFRRARITGIPAGQTGPGQFTPDPATSQDHRTAAA
jgi:hypothetical protein